MVAQVDGIPAEPPQDLPKPPFDLAAGAVRSPMMRKLWPIDQDLLQAHLLRLDPVDRRMRFCGAVSDQTIADHARHINWSRSISLGCFVDDKLIGMAELRAVRNDAEAAELAITVEVPFQNKGVGTLLMRRILAIARNRFICRIYMICLLENQKMQHLAGKLDAKLTFREGEAEASLWPSAPTYLSLLEEASMDGQALWLAVFAPPAMAAVAAPPADLAGKPAA
jgi:RimJ/RimL family protein N-acetyltransferase